MIERVKTPVTKCEAYLSTVHYSDAFRVVLKDDALSAEELYIRIFSHSPKWLKILMKIRNKVVSTLGLKVGSEEGEIKKLKVGERAGMFVIYDISEDEVIAGEDNIHLDFRVSVLKQEEAVIVSTLVHYNNIFGKVYMNVIKPFHRLAVKAVMKNI